MSSLRQLLRPNWGLHGLGDEYSDCAAIVQSHGADYVYKNSRFQYTAYVYHHLSQAFSDRIANLQNAVSSGAFSRVVVTSDEPTIHLGGYNMTVTATSTFDRNSIDDIRANLRSIMETQGYTVSNDSIQLLTAPSLKEICGMVPPANTGGVPGGLPVADGGGSNDGTPPSALGILDEIAAALGVSKTVLILIALAITAGVLWKK